MENKQVSTHVHYPILFLYRTNNTFERLDIQISHNHRCWIENQIRALHPRDCLEQTVESILSSWTNFWERVHLHKSTRPRCRAQLRLNTPWKWYPRSIYRNGAQKEEKTWNTRSASCKRSNTATSSDLKTSSRLPTTTILSSSTALAETCANTWRIQERWMSGLRKGSFTSLAKHSSSWVSMISCIEIWSHRIYCWIGRELML